MRDVEDAVPYKSGEIDQPLSSRIEMTNPPTNTYSKHPRCDFATRVFDCIYNIWHTNREIKHDILKKVNICLLDNNSAHCYNYIVNFFRKELILWDLLSKRKNT